MSLPTILNYKPRIPSKTNIIKFGLFYGSSYEHVYLNNKKYAEYVLNLGYEILNGTEGIITVNNDAFEDFRNWILKIENINI